MKYDEIVWTWFESLVFGLDFCCGNLWKLWCTRSSWSNSSGDGALGHPWPPCKIHVGQLLLQHLATSWWYWKHFEAFWSNRSLCTQMLWALSADTDLAECRTCHLIKISNISIGIVRLFPLNIEWTPTWNVQKLVQVQSSLWTGIWVQLYAVQAEAF